jgi:hypothetical protein
VTTGPTSPHVDQPARSNVANGSIYSGFTRANRSSLANRVMALRWITILGNRRSIRLSYGTEAPAGKAQRGPAD